MLVQLESRCLTQVEKKQNRSFRIYRETLSRFSCAFTIMPFIWIRVYIFILCCLHTLKNLMIREICLKRLIVGI
ncbi:hypothetical protein, partial [Chryseobacterium indoltheticum]|uniref:hypothetical protein n=1 Tax=Chryseobacterium indoltheticum TaxID=254 RepID=UPI003F4937B7